MRNHSFGFERGRGLVWVCDIEGSSKFLNDNASVQAVEEFLPRFHWLARAAVGAAGGQFVKWTGDGFLAWFPIPLHRDLGKQGAAILNMIWHLTVINNVTQLGVNTDKKFRLRHGLTFEHDALITSIKSEGSIALDLIGRAVVLAFRASGIRAEFPCVVTQKEIVEASTSAGMPNIPFKKLAINAEDRLKYFKGERWGIGSLVASAERAPRHTSLSAVLRSSKRAISKAESPLEQSPHGPTMLKFVRALNDGPEWAKAVAREYTRFVQENLLGTLKSLVKKIEPLAKMKIEPLAKIR